MKTEHQADRSAAYSTPYLIIIAFVLCLGWSLLLLLGVYARPITLVHDIGSSFETTQGLYPPEYNGQLSYAYTKGDAILRLPQIGAGRYMITLRMAGPGASVTVPAQLDINSQSVDIGEVQLLRTYTASVAAEPDGDLVIGLQSPRVTLPGDPRSLGLLLDRIEVRSFEATRPPLMTVLSLLVVLALAAAEIIRRALPWRQTIILLAAASTLLALFCGLSRGRIDLATWWSIIGLCVVAAAFLYLSQRDGQGFAQPVYAVATLFITWRLTLWLLAALALHYAPFFQPFTAVIEHDETNAAANSFVATMLAQGWVHWDSTAYLAIAERGYTFVEQRWPSIAFFPLYPLLVRALAFVSGQSAAITALLVAHLAFFGALLLLYKLLEHDFGTTVAYRSVLLLLVCPTSFFFAAAYSEALALLLLVVAVWALRHERWWLAGLAGFLLALTRLPGVLITPIFALAYLQACGWNVRALRWSALAVLLPPAGLGLFMLFQWWRFETPFAFMIAQRSWHNTLSPPWVMPHLLYEYVFTSDYWLIASFQSLFWIGFLVLTIVALWRLPLLYSATLLLFLLPPYFSSWPWSISRHVLMGFPAFVVLAYLSRTLWVRQTVILLLLVLLILATMFFVNGFLVA